MKVKRSTAWCLFIFVAVPHCYSDENNKELAAKYPVLAVLTPPDAKLPPDCSVPQVPPKSLRHLKGLKNRALTDRPNLFLIDRELETVVDVETIRASYFAVYHEKDECGIVGWAFTDPDSAETAYKALAKTFRRQKDYMRLWQIDEYVIWLWRDHDTSDDCFQFFARYLDSRLKTQ